MALTREDCIDDAAKMGCNVACVMAVASVESNGGGFNPDGTPKTLFEGHWFHRYTKGKYAAENPDISYPKWTKQFYGKTWQVEQDRLNRAIALDKKSAYMSASWGMFQVMGFNFSVCGYKDVDSFVKDMKTNEDRQLAAFTGYVLHGGLERFLKVLDWDGFAYHYNGPEYKKNNYAVKLAKAYAKFNV
jgi:hypothetical protein